MLTDEGSPKRRWRVLGTNRENGTTVTRLVLSRSEDRARRIVEAAGISVTSVIPEAQLDVETPKVSSSRDDVSASDDLEEADGDPAESFEEEESPPHSLRTGPCCSLCGGGFLAPASIARWGQNCYAFGACTAILGVIIAAGGIAFAYLLRDVPSDQVESARARDVLRFTIALSGVIFGYALFGVGVFLASTRRVLLCGRCRAVHDSA